MKYRVRSTGYSAPGPNNPNSRLRYRIEFKTWFGNWKKLNDAEYETREKAVLKIPSAVGD
jgi:hypothetical protein